MWLPHRDELRPGSAGVDSVHQLLGYTSDVVTQGRQDEVLFAFDSDDLCEMSWGDVQCVWLLTTRDKLAARDFTGFRGEV